MVVLIHNLRGMELLRFRAEEAEELPPESEYRIERMAREDDRRRTAAIRKAALRSFEREAMGYVAGV